VPAHPFTPEQITALAPDAASARAGQALASPRKWAATGSDERCLWGECQGSGSRPYQVIVDAAEPAFRCTCPSRKFPCKHALGLLFLSTAAGAVPGAAPPEWVAEWLAGRDARAEKKTVRAAEPPAQGPADAEAQARRSERREERVAAGLAELERWLADLVRQGLASAATRPASFWEGMAARLVDAQAPGAARLVRELARVPGSGEDWPERLLASLARLHLLTEAMRRLDALPEPVQADVRGAAGWTQRQDEVLAAGGVRDHWVVLGQWTGVEDRLRVQRTWLRGEASGRTALLLAFAAGGQPLEPGPTPGTRFGAELAFYPGAHPLRALVRERLSAPAAAPVLPGFATVPDALGEWAAALSRNPWTERVALPLLDVVPVRDGGRWLLRDREGRLLPLAGGGEVGWTLLAFGGAEPATVVGEWDGEALLPLAVAAAGRYLELGGWQAAAGAA
jgi:hypothetical protein